MPSTFGCRPSRLFYIITVRDDCQERTHAVCVQTSLNMGVSASILSTGSFLAYIDTFRQKSEPSRCGKDMWEEGMVVMTTLAVEKAL